MTDALYAALFVAIVVACFAAAATVLDLRRCEKYER